MSKTKRTPAPIKRAAELRSESAQRDTLGAAKRREHTERMLRPRNAREAERLTGDPYYQ